MAAFPTEIVGAPPAKDIDADALIAWIHTATVPLVVLLAAFTAGSLITPGYCTLGALQPRLVVTGDWLTALLLGSVIAGGSHLVRGLAPRTMTARLYNGFAAMALAALFMHFGGGRGEAHFPFFILLSFLVYYRDWRPIVFACVLIVAHHIGFFALEAAGWPVIVFSCLDLEVLAIHIAAGAAQALVLCYIALRMSRADDFLRRQANDLRMLSLAIEQNASAIFITDTAGTIQYANPKFYELTGYSSEETIGGTPGLLRSNENPPELYREMWQALRNGQIWRGEFKNRRKDGDLFWCMEYLSPLETTDGRVSHYLAMMENIDERKYAEETIRRLAFFDPLTELPNRRQFHESLHQGLLWAGRAECRLAVVYLDLDRFKEINDTLGHGAGDALLKTVAGRLSGALREGDAVSRLGGDEFALILNNLARPEDAGQVADKILNLMRGPVVLAGRDLAITTSLGIAVFPEDGRTADDLLKHADIALYDAKQQGKNRYRFYDAEANRVSLLRQETEAALALAISRDELFIEYQPQHNPHTRETSVVEALVRWNHPLRGRVPPAEFIPVAEESLLILEIGDWVLRHACLDIQRLCDSCRVAVNVSAHQFLRADFAEHVIAILAETNLSPERLELELTESALIDNPETAIANLLALRAAGIGVALDDFGTGYSSLAYLKRFPVSVLKIDRSFVVDLATNVEAQAIARAIIAVARALDMKVVAEGVENEAQATLLADFGVDLLQGFLLSRPSPLARWTDAPGASEISQSP